MTKIHRLTYEETHMIKETMPYRTCNPIFKRTVAKFGVFRHQISNWEGRLQSTIYINKKARIWADW